MRGKDPDTDEFLGASRTEQRRVALDVLALAQQLSLLDAGHIDRLPIPEGLRGHIADTQRITSHIARKRQLAFLAKQMRREDDETLDAIRDALEVSGQASRRDTAILHRAEAWRDRLVAEGDVALADLLEQRPGADHQALRQLMRNAAEERRRDKPPRSQRELFRAVRDLLADSDAPLSDNDI